MELVSIQVQELKKLLGHINLQADNFTGNTPSNIAPHVKSNGYTEDIVKAQIDLFLVNVPLDQKKIRDDQRIRDVFLKHANRPHDNDEDSDLSKASMAKEKLLAALEEFGLRPQEPLDEVFRTLDTNLDGVLDFEEFKRAVKEPSAVELWVKTMPINELVACALPVSNEGENPLRKISQMCQNDVNALVRGLSHGLVSLIREHISLLTKAFKEVDANAERRDHAAASKFAVNEMYCGKIEDFHSGLPERIGHPHVAFFKAMKVEHCLRPSSTHSFVTTNYHITTSAVREWEFVVDRKECPPSEMKHGRRIPDVDDLVALDVATKCKLTREEVIAIVLYTGPMFQLYNTVLRRCPAPLYKVFEDDGNLFTTTIFVLVSAVQKLSRGKLPMGLVLYRGLGGTARLPDSFFRSDVNGCRGFAEWGFMATTARLDVAMDYSGVREGKPLPMILEIRVGAADRGARIADFSQYEQEDEYMWVPCSFVEGCGPRRIEVSAGSIVHVFPVKVNANLKTMTTEELLSQKKRMHMAAFGYLVDEINFDLHSVAEASSAEDRLVRDKERDAELDLTVEGFLKRIVQQCREVLDRHDKVDSADYTSDSKFRSLVLEMVDVKTWALSKLHEWLENPCAPLRHRFDAALRTVHRRRVAYLDLELPAKPAAERKAASVKVCQVRGLITDSVDEANELGETRLMAAAAEGRSMRVLRALVGAGADVNHARPDGVTAVWLAAQFGHAGCIKALAELRASVSQAANDGATPVYIAAQGGNVECIELLVALGADVGAADHKGITPMHEAAMNNHTSCITALARLRASVNSVDNAGVTPIDAARAKRFNACVELLQELSASQSASVKARAGGGAKKLVISTGDISDVDGFFAVAEYAKTGADVLFIMNYPAYVGVEDADADPSYAVANPGLGYRYSAKQVFDNVPSPAPEAFTSFMARYDGQPDNGRMKSAMTDIAHSLATQVWAEFATADKRGELFFCIGGINQVSPFSPKEVKNEVLTYASMVGEAKRLSPVEGAIYDSGGQERKDFSLADFSDIYMDFNGSMAFLNEEWAARLSDAAAAGAVKGVFVMGGVQAGEAPKTMPSLPNVLNRFSCATMNQLYHPPHTARFFALLARSPAVAVLTVTNNVVEDLATLDAADPPAKTYQGIERFLASNGLDRPFLRRMADAHYLGAHKPPRKAYDYYTALALTAAMRAAARGGEAAAPPRGAPRRLFYSETYGLALVSADDSWSDTLASYTKRTDTEVLAGDGDFVRTKKESFAKEFAVLRTLDPLPYVAVADLAFACHPETKQLAVAAAPPGPPS